MKVIRKHEQGYAILEIAGRYHVAQISPDGRQVYSAARSDMPEEKNSIAVARFDEAGVRYVSRGRTRGGADAAYRRTLRELQ
jgi:hypothetical protein